MKKKADDDGHKRASDQSAVYSYGKNLIPSVKSRDRAGKKAGKMHIDTKYQSTGNKYVLRITKDYILCTCHE